MISVFPELEDVDLKRVMHVQSISHWAPANIGPYSQVVEVGRKVFREFLCGFFAVKLFYCTAKNFSLHAYNWQNKLLFTNPFHEFNSRCILLDLAIWRDFFLAKRMKTWQMKHFNHLMQ